jgi:hypothetical protein
MPLPRYYCDYCEKFFTDTPQMRKRHLESKSHKMMVKLHYDSFKDPAQILAEEGYRQPCPTFVRSGTCPHGTQCKFSHAPQYYPFKDRLGQPREESKYVTFTYFDEDNQKQVVTYSLSELPISMHPPPEGGYNYDEYSTDWGWY